MMKYVVILACGKLRQKIAMTMRQPLGRQQ